MSVLYLSEHLKRIKSVALSVEVINGYIIKLVITNATSATLFYATDEGEKQSSLIKLAAEVTVQSGNEYDVLEKKSSTMSFKFPAKQVNESVSWGPKVSYPWTASDLKLCLNSKLRDGSEITVLCKKCKRKVLNDHPFVLKDLPSDTWAEMMDFWHCHKPHDHNHSETARSYNQLLPKDNTILVGASYFHVLKKDTTLNFRNEIGFCTGCNEELAVSQNDATIKLWKWNVSVQGNGIVSCYPDYLFVSCILAQLVDAHAIYSFLLNTRDNDTKEQLLIWVFNPAISYTTTSSIDLKEGMKVFYSYDSDVIPALQKTRADIEEVILPIKIIQSVKNFLISSTNNQPHNARALGQWRSGIIPIYS